MAIRLKLSTLTLALWALSRIAVAEGDGISQITVTGSHYKNGVGTSDAASQGVINGYLLTDIPILRPGEVLESVPGMVVSQHSGDGKANQYFLRGYNLDHGTDFATSIDSVPVNIPTNAHGQGYTDINYLIPELVQRIDYRKGPYFAENGDFSSAGSANIKYRNSLDHNILDLTVGADNYRRALLAGSTHLSANQSGPTVLGGLELLQNNGPWDSPEKLHKINGLLKLSDGDTSQGWSIDGVGYKAHWHSTDQVPLELIESGQIGRYAALDDSDGGDSTRAILSGEWHRDDEQGYSKVSAFAQRYHLQLWSNFTYFELNPIQGDQFEQFETRNYYGGQLVQGWKQSLFGLPSTTEAGLQLRYDTTHVGLANTDKRIRTNLVTDDQINETLLGAYLQNTTQWTPWFKSVIGGRQDRLQLNRDSHTNALNSGDATGTKFSPKLSLIFGPWQKTELFLNYGKGIHSNDARGVINQVDARTGESVEPVPALVGSTGKEIGLRTEIIDGLQSSVAVWGLDSDSELVYVSEAGTTEPNGASKRYGVEWNNHIIVNKWLLIDADFAWTHARYADKDANGDIGNLIPNAVSKVGLLRATLRNQGGWSTSLETRYIGGYPLSQDGELKTPSSTITNLRVQRELTPRLSLSVDVLNLFNRKYYDIAYQQDYQVTPTSPVVPSGITVHPGEPRELRATLHMKF
ncbi:TonB-dependent receptor [Aquirhabdus parva]|uniref:TonB-dependent receptor n=1 Tax=Aquirhabdus parva TaxID=2283318 RepID=A0A345P4X5_9GAMM|nr:TonB-dependent receptor [Aquirhabdus parva]AXI02334.1 TonB-dependent receptor [Aquirhabdus parva]